MRSNKPLYPLLAGYILNLLVFRIWYYTTDTPIMEVVVIIGIFTALYLLLFFFILTVPSLKRPGKSFLFVSIITIITLFLMQTVYHEEYQLKRTYEKELTKTIQLDTENRIRELETKIVNANKTIALLKEMLMLNQNENDMLKQQLSENIKKTESQEEEQKTKKDVDIQKISNKDFSKINSEASKIDLETKNVAKIDLETKNVAKIDSETKNVANTDSETKNQEIIFKVQILSSSTRLEKKSPKFKGLKDVWEYKENGLYKYTVGNQKDLKSAASLQRECRGKGFNGAFAVAFRNGKRISIREARQLLK
jgi:TolA-binding protein